jgi:hypothetical protein
MKLSANSLHFVWFGQTLAQAVCRVREALSTKRAAVAQARASKRRHAISDGKCACIHRSTHAWN